MDNCIVCVVFLAPAQQHNIVRGGFAVARQQKHSKARQGRLVRVNHLEQPNRCEHVTSG